MAGSPAEALSAAAQSFQMPGYEQQQMQQMSAMMMAAAAGVAGTGAAPNLGSGIGTSGLSAALPGADSLGAFAAGADPMSQASLFSAGVDPSMAQAYASMFTQYLQQAQAYGLGNDPSALASSLGVPPSPFAPQVGAPPSYGATPSVPASPVVSVSVEGMKFQYQLTEDDLLKVFSRYGLVKHIHVDEVGTAAQITFGDFTTAQNAMNDLNGKVLNGLDGTLRLNWADQGQATAPVPYSMMPPLSNWSPFGGAASPAWPSTSSAAPDLANMLAPLVAPPPAPSAGTQIAGDVALGLPAAMPTASSATGADAGAGVGISASSGSHDVKSALAHVKGVRKYTCRFLIGIENDKDFQVVRRIIGAKGTNMKRIVKQTEAKLRLRGVGSGYFEGAGQRESSEPLQLCVSCTSSDGYRTAVRLVEELLETVYNEYRQYCRENGRPEPDLRASPQLVSSAGGRGGGAGTGFGASAGLDDDIDENDSDEDALADGAGESPSGKRDGRRRGRRSRAKKSDPGKGGGGERGDPPPKAPPVDDIERLIDARNEARRQCNFQEADRIRQSLHEKGVALMDEPGARGKGIEVTTWRYWRE